MSFFDNRGVSLVEISVAIVVIGIIAAAAATTHGMIERSKLQSIIKEMSDLSGKVISFKEIYGYFPGDFPDPDIWGTGVGSCEDTGGDGNDLIEFKKNSDDHVESFAAWCHLHRSGMIGADVVSTSVAIVPAGTMLGANSKSGTLDSIKSDVLLGVDIPKARKINNAGYMLMSSNDLISSFSTASANKIMPNMNVLVFFSVNPSTLRPSFSSKKIYGLDAKIGFGLSGFWAENMTGYGTCYDTSTMAYEGLGGYDYSCILGLTLPG